MGGHNKGNLDVERVIEAILDRDPYDTFVLFLGDSDFEPLLRHLRRMGKRVLVVATRGHVAIELIRNAKFVNLKKLQVELAN